MGDRQLSGPRAARREAVRDFKRRAILDAAKRVFHARGIEGASMRGIAEEAGYTAGAIYSYYPAKEHIYADMLADSIAALGRAVREATAAAPDPAARARQAVHAFYAFYRDHPSELDLSFYLFRGIGPRGLGPALDRQLNGRLITALQAISRAVAGLGDLDESAANQETVAAVAHLSGVLLLERSGRLKVLGYAGEALVERYLAEMSARLSGPHR